MSSEHDSDFLFADEQDAELKPAKASQPGWKILIVDDEPEVHAVTRLALMEMVFEGRGIEFISAHSRAEAEAAIDANPDVAIVLLDVVMETDDAGLQVVNYIRQHAHNRFTRIVLRTGQPGHAPERAVVLNYDINDYKSKTELTAQKLFTCVMSALRSYRDIIEVDQARQRAEAEVAELKQQLQQLKQG
ncbi:hypothetical protein CWI83_03735 [Pseudidiomarina taiwanensis]|uniref:Response regulatory domain-containing protein n=1 Tax=Pseudidiomarina taiwanensis TaxID=337250 RepID=A0A432ZP37_9GAMM|nr:hypothetical protein CWI83_03735 [Pseudidiomarina taiwanensis]